MHVIAPADVLAQSPLKNAVALLSLRDAVRLQQEGQEARPQGAARLAVTVDGTETEAEVAALKVGPIPSFGFINPKFQTLNPALKARPLVSLIALSSSARNIGRASKASAIAISTEAEVAALKVGLATETMYSVELINPKS